MPENGNSSVLGSAPPRVRLVCIDLDGTLIGSTGVPTQVVWDTADQALTAGLHLAICTARPGTGLAWEWATRLDSNGWHQFQTGASIMHTGNRETRSALLPVGVAERCRDHALDAGWIFEAYSHTDYIVDSSDQAAKQHADLLGIPYLHRSLDSLDGAVVRAHLIVTDTQLPAALASISDDCEASSATSPVMPGYNFVSITARGVDKSSGVSTIADLLGCRLSEVMMIGDGHNDVPAMKVVGYPVSMGNAPADVAAAARFRVAHVDDDGVAEALKLAISTIAWN